MSATLDRAPRCACACHVLVDIDRGGKAKMNVQLDMASLISDLDCMISCDRCWPRHNQAMRRKFGDRTTALRSRPPEGGDYWQQQADDQC